MSNTSPKFVDHGYSGTEHARARIVLWQSAHGCSALPKPLQPPARANPVMRYPSAAGFLLLDWIRGEHKAPASGACLFSHWPIYERIGIRLGKVIKRDDPAPRGSS
jgi:hypothetical protein